MKTTFVVLSGLAMLLTGCVEENARRVSCLCGNWKFTRDASCALDASATAFDDAAWQTISVPHDWAISGPFDPEADGGSGKLPWRGVGWYRRTFDVTPEQMTAIEKGAALWLEFDGVMASPQVFVNGQKAGGWDYGYMSFRVDAAPFVQAGSNVLAVRADTRNHNSRWYPGAGIYRRARLVFAPAVHVVADSAFVTTPGVAKESASVRVAFTVTNRLGAAISAETGVRLRDADGVVVAQAALAGHAIAAKGAQAFTCDIEVRNPKFWDVESPNLYTAEVGVRGGGAVDAQTVRFGIRTIEFTADDGFHLNGRRVQIQGVDLHSDMGPLGMAFDRSAMRRQLALMKDMGANGLRTSHNACDPQVLELCDEMGIVVWNECFDKWEGTSGRRADQNLEEYVSRNLRAFARRDRNHPCVVVWSIGNEIPPKGWDWGGKNPKAQDGMSAERFRLFRAAIREFDTTRPVGIGCCHGQAIETGMFEELDITGWNYNASYRAIKKRHPDKPCLYSESASALSSYGYFEQPPASGKAIYDVAAREVGGYDHNAAPWSDIPDVEFAYMEQDRYCGGEFVWTGIDYLGEPTPYIRYNLFPMMKDLKKSELARSSYFGIVDLMGIPKDRFYIYRSHWNRKDETVHIVPHWNWTGREGKSIPVYVYTSGDEAELFLNGTSLGRRAKGVSQKPENFAAGRPATASTCETWGGKNNVASAAVDGRNDTRWCAAGDMKGQWWQVDLGVRKAFSCVFVSGEQGDATYDWTIRVSDDGKNWRDYAAKKLGASQNRAPKAENARYVLVVFNDMKSGAWASIREVVVSEAAEVFRINPYYDVCDRYRLRWFDVPYAPGELKVVAYRKGVKVGEQTMKTAQKAERVQLTLDPYSRPQEAGEAVFVQVDVVDAAGVRDPWAKDRVTFALTGPGRIVAVGNGNPRAHEVFTKTDSHPLYFGKAVVVVRRDPGATEPVTLTASCDGLKSASLSF